MLTHGINHQSSINNHQSSIINHQSSIINHQSGAYSRDHPSRVPPRHPHIIYRRPPSGRSRFYRVTQLRTVGVHCRESTGTGPVLLKVVRVTSAAFSGFTMCACVCFLPIHSGHRVRWTYQPGSHRRRVPQDFSSSFFAVRDLIFLARRIQPFLSLVDRDVEFCLLTI